MPRPRRATDCRLHHVTTRANNRRQMYEDVDDRETFYGILGRALARSTVLATSTSSSAITTTWSWRVRSRTCPRSCGASLSDALAYNARHERINHLCGRRFYCTSIADRRGLRAVAIYVALNPVRAGFCADAARLAVRRLWRVRRPREPRAHLTTGLVEDLFGSDGSLEQACDAALRIGRPGRPALATLLPPRRVVTREHVTQAIKVFGYTHAEIARHYRVTSRTLNRWLAVSRH